MRILHKCQCFCESETYKELTTLKIKNVGSLFLEVLVERNFLRAVRKDHCKMVKGCGRKKTSGVEEGHFDTVHGA